MTQGNFAVEIIAHSITPKSLVSLNSQALILPLNKTVLKSTAPQIAELVRRLQRSGDLNLKRPGTGLSIPTPSGMKAQRLILIAIDETDTDVQKMLLKALSILASTGAKRAHLVLNPLAQSAQNLPRTAQECAHLAMYHSYHYSRSPQKAPTPLEQLCLVSLKEGTSSPSAQQLQRAGETGRAIGNGRNSARELAETPPNICTPVWLASRARALARQYNTVHTIVLNESAMAKLGMGALLQVGRGSENPPRLIQMEYRPRGTARQSPVVLVGKGITFDTGGISLKPSARMDEMKFDMSGAAAVFGVMRALAELQWPIRVIGLVAAAENMPDGRAGRPGDVVKTMSGKTVEILNTDAEGRLVLCDALTYAERYKPELVIDMATLTGACVVALGHIAAGLFSNCDELAEALTTAGQTAGDRVWRLPMWNEYRQQLRSDYADLANIGGPSAGTITAACFLGEFAKHYRWAHLDIAGVAYPDRGKKRSTGRPVPLLMEFLASRLG